MNAKFTKTSNVYDSLNFLLSEVVSLRSKMKKNHTTILVKGGITE